MEEDPVHIIVEDDGEYPDEVVMAEEIVITDDAEYVEEEEEEGAETVVSDEPLYYEQDGQFFTVQDGRLVEVIENNGFFLRKQHDEMMETQPKEKHKNYIFKMNNDQNEEMSDQNQEMEHQDMEHFDVEGPSGVDLMLDDGQYVDGGTIETEMPISNYTENKGTYHLPKATREHKMLKQNDDFDRRCFGCRQELRKDIYYEHVRMISNYGSCNPVDVRKFACIECEECMATIEKLCEHMFLAHDAPTQIQIREFPNEEEFDMFVVMMENSGSPFLRARSTKRLRKGVVQFLRCEYRTYTGSDSNIEEPCTAFITKVCQVNGRIEARYCTHHHHGGEGIHVPLKVKTRLYEMAVKRLPPVVVHRVIMEEIPKFALPGSRIEVRLRKLTVDMIINVVSSLLKRIDDEEPKSEIQQYEHMPESQLSNMLNNILDENVENVENEEYLDVGDPQKLDMGLEEHKFDEKLPMGPIHSPQPSCSTNRGRMESLDMEVIDPQPSFSELGPEYRYNPMCGRDAKVLDLSATEQRVLDDYEVATKIIDDLTEEQIDLRDINRKRQVVLKVLKCLRRIEDITDKASFQGAKNMNVDLLVDCVFKAEEAIDDICELEAECLDGQVSALAIKKHLIRGSKLRYKMDYFKEMLANGIEKIPPGIDEEDLELYVQERFKEIILTPEISKRGRPGRKEYPSDEIIIEPVNVRVEETHDYQPEIDDFESMNTSQLMAELHKRQRDNGELEGEEIVVEIDEDENAPPYSPEPSSDLIDPTDVPTTSDKHGRMRHMHHDHIDVVAQEIVIGEEEEIVVEVIDEDDYIKVEEEDEEYEKSAAISRTGRTIKPRRMYDE